MNLLAPSPTLCPTVTQLKTNIAVSGKSFLKRVNIHYKTTPGIELVTSRTSGLESGTITTGPRRYHIYVLTILYIWIEQSIGRAYQQSALMKWRIKLVCLS